MNSRAELKSSLFGSVQRIGLALVACSLSLAFGTACQPEIYCTEEARSSVQVTVVDESGNASLAATVRYQLNGGDWANADCVVSAEAGCEEWVTGYEQPGTYNIEASSEGYQTATATVEVLETEDGCHVDTEQVVLTLNNAV